MLGTSSEPTLPPHHQSNDRHCGRNNSPERATGLRTSPSDHAYSIPHRRNAHRRPAPDTPTRTPLPHAKKTWFPGQASLTCDNVRSWAVPARGGRSCGVRRRREPGQRHGCGGSVPGTTGRRRPLGARGRAYGSRARETLPTRTRPVLMARDREV